jgi:hypothetical protein
MDGSPFVSLYNNRKWNFFGGCGFVEMMNYFRASLKILRTTNRWNLFRHSSQNSFAEDELCTRIFVARRMARTDRKIFSSLAARRIFRDALYFEKGELS